MDGTRIALCAGAVLSGTATTSENSKEYSSASARDRVALAGHTRTLTSPGQYCYKFVAVDHFQSGRGLALGSVHE